MEMAQAAADLGMQYLTITDHSPSAHYAGGLDIAKLKEQWREIEQAKKETKIQILKGTESDITQEGNLDYPDDVLDKFDIVIASVHNRFKLTPAQMTERLLCCMRKPHFKIWGHPLGQLLLRREPIKCDVEKVLDAIAESRAAIEINGDPHRMDLAPQWVRLAKRRGIKLIISTDAHSTSDLRNLIYGIHLARRAGVRKSDVLNTLPQDEFADFVRPALLPVR
jgi:DNA polymerase (family 10)